MLYDCSLRFHLPSQTWRKRPMRRERSLPLWWSLTSCSMRRNTQKWMSPTEKSAASWPKSLDWALQTWPRCSRQRWMRLFPKQRLLFSRLCVFGHALFCSYPSPNFLFKQVWFQYCGVALVESDILYYTQSLFNNRVLIFVWGWLLVAWHSLASQEIWQDKSWLHEAGGV